MTTLHRSRDLSEAAERQMRTWALGLEARKRLEEQNAATLPKKLIQPFVAISRETGVNAHDIAELIAKRLSWKVLGWELLDYMVEQYHWSRIALEYVDERTASWFHETFGKWLDQQIVSQAEYVSRLGNIVLIAAQHESNVFVGRGAQFILPRDAGLSVRIIAPKDQRIKSIMERRQCSHREAGKFVDDTDRGRADFVQRYFQRDVADPHLYDLVVNLEHTPRESAVELILGDYMLRFDQQNVTSAFRTDENLSPQPF
jgi:cytidylate kinase-like protein